MRQVVDAVLCGLIVVNVAAAALSTVDTYYARHHMAFDLIEVVSVLIFTVEYAARLWVAVEHPLYREYSAFQARLRYAVSPLAVIDLLAIAPFYLVIFFNADARILRIFRLVRLLKLARYSPALGTLARVLAAERRALAAALVVMGGLLLTAATAGYYAERHAQPESFASVPHAIWWALATLTTVGYGDVVPVTVLGKVIGAFVMLFGLGMFALPIGIIASGFANEIHRREFVVTWGMVARVPLFAGLNAVEVSHIASLLRAETVPSNTVIVRAGDPADCMYFIASGEVEAEVGEYRHHLGEGDFFGELALLRRGKRGATIRSLSKCQLMVLGVGDFNNLMEARPKLRAEIERIAHERLGRSGLEIADDAHTGTGEPSDAGS